MNHMETDGAAKSQPDHAAELQSERERTREVDHRAKNSLQLAASLALLMARRTPSGEARAALKALHNRIAAIGSVHRGFATGLEFGRFDVTAFVEDQLALSSRAAPEGAELRTDLEALDTRASCAAPLALILNELVSNALLHSGAMPKVTVRLRRFGEDGFRLDVADEGPGLPESAESLGFGLTLVRLMAQQLRAELAFEAMQPGLRVVVKAP